MPQRLQEVIAEIDGWTKYPFVIFGCKLNFVKKNCIYKYLIITFDNIYLYSLNSDFIV